MQKGQEMFGFSSLVSPARRACGLLTGKLAEFRSNEGGNIATMTAILSPVLVGGMGLGAEAGYWYYSKNELQNAVDAAAHATALRSNNGDAQAALEDIATFVVGQAGVNLTQSNVAVNQPPTQGGFINDGGAVEIDVTRSVPRMFSAMWDNTPVQINARAVATAQSGGRGCVIALSDTEQGALSITGSADINLDQCDFVSNAAGVSFEMTGNGSTAVANCVQATGTATTTAGLTTTCATLRENSAPIADPFASVPEPVATGACQSSSVGKNNQSTTVTPAEAHTSGMSAIRYCNGMNIRGNVTLNPGLYLIEGGEFKINSNATITGTGVTFFLADGVEIRFNGTASLDVTAPSSGVYNGILIFGSRAGTNMDHRINGNISTVLNGAIYTPESHIDYLGNAQTSFDSCSQIIADTIDFSGNGTISMHCLFPTGPTADVSGQVAIVE